jgi:hypothetical protein
LNSFYQGYIKTRASLLSLLPNANTKLGLERRRSARRQAFGSKAH